MMSIRSQQYETMELEQHNKFVRNVSEHCRSNWEEQTQDMDDEQLSHYIEKQLISARSHNIRFENDLVHYVNLSFVWGEKFGTNNKLEEISAILNNKTLEGPAKIFQLRNYTKEYLTPGSEHAT